LAIFRVRAIFFFYKDYWYSDDWIPCKPSCLRFFGLEDVVRHRMQSCVGLEDVPALTAVATTAEIADATPKFGATRWYWRAGDNEIAHYAWQGECGQQPQFSSHWQGVVGSSVSLKRSG
jgi:hypothetical protein